MNEQPGTSLKEVWESFVISQTSRGVSEATVKNYHNHLKSISHHIDIEMPMDMIRNRQKRYGWKERIEEDFKKHRQSRRS